MPVVVSDASVLISLGAIGKLSLLAGSYLVLMDETEGRTAAKALGLAVAGTLAVLVRAKHEGKVRHLKPLLDQLVAHHHFRLARRLYEAALVEVGETP